MRDVLRGALMENLIIDKWVTCRKCEKLPFEKARKGTKRHERAQVGRHILSEYAPNHVAIWLLQPDCRLKTCWKFTSSYLLGKKAVFLIWQFPGMPPSQEGVGHAWRFHWISLNFIEFHWIFTKIRPARSRLYQRIFEFFLRVRWEGAFNSQFLKEKRQNSKKKEREKFEWKLQKSWFLRIFRLWGGPKEAISTSFWSLSSRWRRMQPNLGPCEEINQKFNEILVKKFGRS